MILGFRIFSLTAFERSCDVVGASECCIHIAARYIVVWQFIFCSYVYYRPCEPVPVIYRVNTTFPPNKKRRAIWDFSSTYYYHSTLILQRACLREQIEAEQVFLGLSRRYGQFWSSNKSMLGPALWWTETMTVLKLALEGCQLGFGSDEGQASFCQYSEPNPIVAYNIRLEGQVLLRQ